MLGDLEYLLIQVRKSDDPMATHEVDCFASHLHCTPDRIRPWDLLAGSPNRDDLRHCDIVLFGGSGDYSVVTGGEWLAPAMDAMRLLYEHDKPTFASCWGCQAMARALGGTVRHEPECAEVGTHQLHLTDAGHSDPTFAPLGDSFLAQMGHEDIVHTLPDEATLLASSKRTTVQAWTIPGKPLYCTQFHPELNLSQLLDRLRHYPKYIKRITGLDYEAFVEQLCTDSRETDGLLTRFASQVMGI
jgi:GMP synthase (glutamine-hydrolysing)